MLPLYLLNTLRQLVFLRTLTVATYLAAMLTAVLVLEWHLPLPALLGICLLLLLYNGLTLWRIKLSRGGVAVTRGEIARQLAVDIVGHGLWLFFLGGATNPFTAWFLLPLTIAAASLPGRFTWALTALTIACYSTLLIWYQPLPISEQALAQAFFFHTLGMWLAFVGAALIVAGLVARIGRQLRDREHALAEARESGLRQQQILGLAIQAAGAAHRLGTPLATLTVLVDELLQDHAAQPALVADLTIMQQQLLACRKELDRLRTEHTAVPSQAADSAMAALLDDWRVVRPSAQVDFHRLGQGEPPLLILPFALRQALMNLLDNAADASPAWQGLTLDWSAERIWIQVEDSGPGFDGRASETLAGQGLGMGVVLAVSAIERAGGHLAWLARSGGGTCARIGLPAATI
ncbi:HAMP domain-containing histidine kinase [Chitinimonas arctica]|uniref:histidine kinase n=1 Tax=Chitinimonas arctica TaxID=2594795 RepID=A0A516SES6_9NEIS|nr:ATP-binding protein [Chitinimonas arctica]QDQ26643.1 HAMP domain-containing histidine kinase [Chitinimonas arctica]